MFGRVSGALRREALLCLLAAALFLGVAQQPVFGQAGTSFANAALISSGTYSYAISPSANHFFKFEAARGQSVEVTLTMQSSDLNLYLYSEAQTVVASSTQAAVGVKEEIRYLVKYSGYYYIRVENKLPIMDTYTLTFTPVAPGATLQEALTILEGTYNYTIDSKGEHYFKIGGRVGQTLTARLTPTAQLDLSLTVYGPDGEALASSDRSGLGGVEALQTAVNVEGGYYLKVSNLREAKGVYSLTVNLVRFDVAYVTWGSLTSPIEVDAGEVAAPLTVGIKAAADFSLTSLEGELQLKPPFVDPLGRSSLKSSYNFTIPPSGGLALFTYRLNILDWAQKGFYTLPLTITYYTNQPEGLAYGNPVNITIQVPITGKSRLEVNVNASGLDADTVNPVRFTFRNLGSADLSALKVTVSPTPPLIIAGEEADRELGSIRAGEVKSLEASIYTPPSSAGGTYQLTLTISYRNSVGGAVRESRSISFYVNAVTEAEIDLTASKQVLGSGRVDTLDITVKNSGVKRIYSAKLSLTLTPPLRLEGKDNVWHIGDLGSGEAKSVSVKVYAPREAIGQTFQIAASVTYRPTPNIQLASTRSIAVSVEETKAPNIIVESTEANLVAGGRSVVKIRVANNSTSTIRQLDATLTLPPPLTADIDRWRLDQIPPSGYAVLQLEVYTPASAAASTFNSKLTLTYYDEEDVKFTETYTVGLVASKIAPSPLLTLKVEDNTLTLGAVETLNYKVVNIGESTAYSLEASASTQPPLTIVSGTKQRVGDLNAGQEADLTISIRAPSDLTEGPIPLTFTFTYYDESGLRRTEAQQSTLLLTRSTQPALSVDYSPKEVVVGGAEEVKITLRNLLNEALNALELRFTPSSPTIQLGGLDRIEVGTLDPGGEATVSARLYAPKSALGSTGTLTVTARFITAAGDAKTESYTLGFYVSSSRQSGVKLRLFTEDYNLYASKVNEAVLKLVNLGEEDANRVSVELRLPPTVSIVGDSGNWYFDKIERGGEAHIRIRVFAPKSALEGVAPAESVQATLLVRYLDTNGFEWAEELTSGFTIRGYISLSVSSLSVRPDPVAPSSTFTVSGVVYNGGIVSAKNVNVTAYLEPPFERTFPHSTILGEITKDGQSSFSLTLKAGDAAPGTYPLRLLVHYSDDRGELHVVNATVQVNVAKPATQQTQRQPPIFEINLFMIPAAFVLGALVSWLIFRRRKGTEYQGEDLTDSTS